MKKISTLFFALFLFSIGAQAQDYPGFNQSNYAGVSGIDLQPASIVDNRMKVDISLFGFSVSAYNNYIGLKPSALLRDGNMISGTYAAFEDTLFQSKYLNERYDDKLKSVYFSQQIQLPSFMFKVGEKSALGFTWRLRNYVNVDGVEKELARLIYNELNYPTLWVDTLSNEHFSVQTMSWAEYGITYGRIMMDKGEHFLKVGGRLKVLQGLQAAYMFVDNLAYNFSTDSTLSLFQSDVNYGHSTNFEFDENSIKYKFVSNFSIGLDLGVVYEWRPDHADFKYEMDGRKDRWRDDQNKYKLRAGLSILDLGNIKFKKGQLSNDFTANVNYWNLNNLDFGDTPVEAFDDTIRSRFGTNSSEESFKMNLPTAISLQVDYNIWKDFYVNHTTYFAFQFKNNANKVHDITTFSITPKYDHKWFGVFVPVSYNLMGNFQVGTGLRLGPLYLGTTNLNPIAQFVSGKGNGKKDIYGADFHMILKIPIPYSKPRDKDGDFVSDKLDKCNDAKGVWEFTGCPDRDGDHIQDSQDDCPDEPGIPAFKGCPDTDGDGIMDKADNCPTEAGPREYNGCPDKDGDKIIDKEDECPEVPGVIAFKGCPDTDGDGLPDPKDDCPTIAGPHEFKGCPDTDGDGLRDIEDKCPEKPGPIHNLGCPDRKLQILSSSGVVLEEVAFEDGKFNFTKDVDKKNHKFRLLGEGTDTLTQVMISAPNLRGKTAFKEGDKLFHFPKEAEVVVLTPEEQAIVKKAFDNLEFATGKDIIKKESLPSLDELAALMKKYPGWKLKIEGHTDNQGARASNVTLSKKRAEAVKKYLVSKGIEASRFEVKWYGPDRPIAPNDTEEGRQKNRRVEMTIVE
jgi:outer membrane protein OmpA-like peptidoglycan-associated protein